MRWAPGLVVSLLTGMLLAGCVEGQELDEVMLADGRAARMDHWDGRWLMINYWAEWCAPCRKEIPEFNELHAQRSSTGLVVLGVNYDGLVGAKLTKLIEEMGIEFPVLVEDPRWRWAQDPPPVLPTTLIINPEGELHRVLVGPQTHETLLASLETEGSE